jgi:hypothetical protein
MIGSFQQPFPIQADQARTPVNRSFLDAVNSAVRQRELFDNIKCPPYPVEKKHIEWGRGTTW